MDQIRIIKITDKEYPKILKKIPDAPKVLYIRGKFPIAKNYVGIVGARRCTVYGKQIALEIGGGLAKTGIVIVSGMAEGIDTFAHQSALQNNCPTIAVLGTGLDRKSIYPQSNLKMMDNIIKQGGCIISEFPEGTPGHKANFPKRNRIVSALSQALVVVEAKEKSGSLITANYSKSYQKPVFAVPGPIYSQCSAGCNKIIKNNDAKLITDYKDILLELNIINNEGNQQICLLGLTDNEKMVLKALSAKPSDIDTIIQATKLSAQDVCIAISNLEIDGKIKNLGSNIFSISK
jgi:DNA processing protein